MTARPFRVALTRPDPQGAETAARLAAKGFGIVRAPLLSLRLVEDWGSAEGFGALALTSRTAAFLLKDRPAFHHIAAFCVGEATARDARQSGLQNVASADGDVDDLLPLLLERAVGPVLHLCGADHRGALVERLTAAGRTAERRIVYKMAAASSLPAVAAAPDAVLLYSPRTAAIYDGLRKGTAFADVPAVVMSQAVADALGPGAPAKLARRPDETALLEALEDLRMAHA